MLGDVARIVHVIERTAAAGDAAFGRKLRQTALIPELHGQADNALAPGAAVIPRRRSCPLRPTWPRRQGFVPGRKLRIDWIRHWYK